MLVIISDVLYQVLGQGERGEDIDSFWLFLHFVACFLLVGQALFHRLQQR